MHDTVITFETVPPTADKMAGRIAGRPARPRLAGGRRTATAVVGYAYGGEYKERAAYAWACEVSVYLEMGLRRTGLGRALYEELFARLAGRGFLTAVAGMTLPNPASEGLHRALRLRAGGHLPQDRLEARRLARRGLDPARAGAAAPASPLRCAEPTGLRGYVARMLRLARREPSALLFAAQLLGRPALPVHGGQDVGRALFSVFGIAILGLVLLAVRDRRRGPGSGCCWASRRRCCC